MQWVVLYTIEYDSGTLITDFYRGDYDECQRIKAASGGGEHDLCQTIKPWKPKVGPAHEWDRMMRG